MSKKPQQQDGFYIVLDALFKGIGALFMWIFRGGKQSSKQQALEKARAEFRSAWHVIEASSKEPARRHHAIMQADILLDRALQFHKIPGNTLGERLKASTSKLSRDVLDAAWRAHKVRNRIAHELHATLSDREAQQAMTDFRTVLKTLELL
jgi:hypothetical protein